MLRRRQLTLFHFYDSVSSHLERTVMLGVVCVVVMLMLASTLVPKASATVRPYVWPTLNTHRLALEEMAQQKQLATSSARSLTQQLLDDALFTYQTVKPSGEARAQQKMLGYLLECGIDSDMAELLMEAIASGHYKANPVVVEGLRALSSQ